MMTGVATRFALSGKPSSRLANACPVPDRLVGSAVWARAKKYWPFAGVAIGGVEQEVRLDHQVMIESPVVRTLKVPQALSQRPRERGQAVAQLFLLGQREREAIVLGERVVHLDTPNGTVVEQGV